ncbi:condensation domain-containing protein, partial [Streptomyces sp. NPDC053755]|uniref:condensation domain-containing protein n=1 Tax=Streptomyces sp. NPDC053755 TaxID=3155815 RepID=UPI00343E1E5C
MTPLSFAQRRLWFLGRLEGPSATYNAPVVLHLDGTPDPAVLGAALVDLVERHEVLRTVLPAGPDAEPRQEVREPGAVPPPEVVRCPPATWPDRVAAFVREPVDVTAGPPLRVRLFTAPAGPDGGEGSVLVLLLHHIATDGWSVRPLLRDLDAAYRARLAGRAPAWEPLPVQYADYAVWQRELLGDPEDPESLAAEQLDHWRRRLEGAPAVTALPADRPRPTEPSGRGGTLTARVPVGTHRALLALAKEHRASLPMVVRAALAAALAAAGSGPDLVIGTPVAGRPEEDLYELVGFFVNTLALRTDLSGDPSAATLLERVRDADLAAYEHQDLPFELLVERLAPERSLGHHPLFQVMLNVDGAEGTGPVALGPHLTGRPGTADLGAAKFDLTFSCGQRVTPDGSPDGLDLALGYAVDLFDASTARLLLDLFTRALEGFARDAGRPLGALSLTTAEERAGLAARHEALAAARAATAGAPDRERGGLGKSGVRVGFIWVGA